MQSTGVVRPTSEFEGARLRVKGEIFEIDFAQRAHHTRPERSRARGVALISSRTRRLRVSCVSIRRPTVLVAGPQGRARRRRDTHSAHRTAVSPLRMHGAHAAIATDMMFSPCQQQPSSPVLTPLLSPLTPLLPGATAVHRCLCVCSPIITTVVRSVVARQTLQPVTGNAHGPRPQAAVASVLAIRASAGGERLRDHD